MEHRELEARDLQPCSRTDLTIQLAETTVSPWSWNDLVKIVTPKKPSDPTSPSGGGQCLRGPAAGAKKLRCRNLF
eukprot:12368781-Karenia_brevis.AAC.1